MKRILLDIISNIAVLLWFGFIYLSTIINSNASPLIFDICMSSLYLVFINILFDFKYYKCRFPIWRIIHCLIIIIVANILTCTSVINYVNNVGGFFDVLTQSFLYYSFIISIGIVVLGFVIYQSLVSFVLYHYKK